MPDEEHKNEQKDVIRSIEAVIHVHGIPTVEVAEAHLEQNSLGTVQLKVGKIARVEEFQVCSHPAPHVLWVHNSSAIVASGGHSCESEFILRNLISATPNYYILPLTPAIDKRQTENGTVAPSAPIKYCHWSHLVIGKVTKREDRQWTVVVNNGAQTITRDISRQLGLHRLMASAAANHQHSTGRPLVMVSFALVLLIL